MNKIKYKKRAEKKLKPKKKERKIGVCLGALAMFVSN